MSLRPTTALLMAAMIGSSPAMADELDPPPAPLRLSPPAAERGVSRSSPLAVRAPLGFAFGVAVTYGSVVVLYLAFGGEGEGSASSGSTAAGVFFLAGLPLATAGAVCSMEGWLEGAPRGRFGWAAGGAAVGTIVMAAALSNSEGTPAALSLLAPALGAVVGYELSRRPAPAAIRVHGSSLRLGLPVPRPKMVERRGRRAFGVEAALLQVRF